jgi:predicted PhzF superfamily epimerase YddE/YHI9
VISAPGDEVDFVSRCFYPEAGIEEDPVTGSAHTMLTPYWANQFNKNKLYAYQLSKRGGKLNCRLANERVLISGNSVIYFEGTISIV